MTVECFIGRRVWMKVDRFRSIAGTVLAVPTAAKLDDLQRSIAASTFKISLPGGKFIELPGSQILKFDCAPRSQTDMTAA
jgi:hypothetical protein